METIYLTFEQVILIHQDQVDRYGGSHGIRDLTLLESAVFRPQSSFAQNDLYLTLFEKAAALLHSLVTNHAFVDGNKRTGAASMLVFLELNGYRLFSEQDALVTFILEIIEKRLSIANIAQWIEDKTKLLSQL